MCRELQKNKKLQLFSNFRDVIVRQSVVPPVMAIGFYFPETNYKGEKINECYDSTIVQKAIAITCAASPDSNSGIIVLSAPQYSKDIIKDLYKNLNGKNGKRVLEYIVNILFLYEENITFSPTWWDKLPTSIQSKFRSAIQKNLPIK